MLQHMPELKTDKEEVLKKYGNVFSLKNIDKLTPEKISGISFPMKTTIIGQHFHEMVELKSKICRN